MPPAPRLAVLGPRALLDLCVTDGVAGGVEIMGVAPTDGNAASTLRRLAPEVVVALDPLHFPPEIRHAGLDAITVAFVVDEPQGMAGGESGFDRVMSVDGADTAWRREPLPVADALFGVVGRPAVRPRALFIGDGGDRRDRFLLPLKHDFDLLHAVSGLSFDDLAELLARVDAGLVVHAEEGRQTTAHTALVHLAAGHLLLAEQLPRAYGLRPGLDFVEIRESWQAWEVLHALRRVPDAFRSMRLTGRSAAERFRATRAWPRIARDVICDVQAFGRSGRGPRAERGEVGEQVVHQTRIHP